MRARARTLAAAVAVAAAGTLTVITAPSPAASAAVLTGSQSSARSSAVTASTAACASPPRMMSYFRTWRDTASDPSINTTNMAQLPRGVDVAFVFPDGSEPQAFWTALRDSYVPTLHARGTKVVQSVGIAQLLDRSYPNTTTGYAALAQHLMDSKVTAYGLDGLDVDVERTLSGEDLERATGVLTALSGSLGPSSGTGRLLIFDTNLDGNQPLFTTVAPTVDFVLEQSYGRSVSGLQSTWDTYADDISPCQYLIGFSFYEERGANWGDTTTPMMLSRAWQYADWQPTGAQKGGIFSYAVDRDGVPIGDDTLAPTTYSWTTALKNHMAATNVALGRPATASSVRKRSFPASAAVDGDPSTRWQSAYRDPQTLTVDLGSTTSITAMTIQWDTAYASAYQIQTSPDGSTWTTVGTRTSTGGADVITGLTGSGRYVRLLMTSAGTSSGDSIRELEVFSS